MIKVKIMELSSEIIFTRYLYIKQEVEIVLILSILEKKEDNSLFWAYELYHSGFIEDLFILFIEIYYNFYATLNINFGTYLYKKYKEHVELNKPIEDRLISMIIHNFLTRPYNLDIFILREVFKKNKNNFSIKEIKSYMLNNDFISISCALLSCDDEITLIPIVNLFVEELNSRYLLNLNTPNLVKEWKKRDKLYDSNIVLLSIILYYFSQGCKLKIGKNVYVSIPSEEVIIYETNEVDINSCSKKPHIILSQSALLSINDSTFLSIFMLEREKVDIKELYWYHWLYYGSFSPIWKERIDRYNGFINHENKKIDFMDDEMAEEFYELYNYGPDEQSLHVQNRSIGEITLERTWEDFYKTFHKNGLVEMEKIPDSLFN